MTHLFSDPRVVEAACVAAWGGHHWPNVPNAANEREYMAKALTAAGAALPRQETVEAMMEAVAAEFGACSNVTAERVLVRVGLIPGHVIEDAAPRSGLKRQRPRHPEDDEAVARGGPTGSNPSATPVAEHVTEESHE